MRPFSIGLFLLLGASAFGQQSVPEIPFDSAPNFFKLPAGLRRKPSPPMSGGVIANSIFQHHGRSK